LILSGCATPQQPSSTEALAEQKQQARAGRAKQIDKENEKLRLSVRQFYIDQHPTLSAEFRKAILKERLKVGMSMWDVIAAYSLWEYATEPQAASYRNIGVLPLWRLADRRQTVTAQGQQDEWILRRENDTQRLFFQSGALTEWKD
jgi:hypothetical protein